MNTEYLKVREAAGVARISPYRMRQLLRERRVVGVRPGGRGSWRIPMESLRSYMNEPEGVRPTA